MREHEGTREEVRGEAAEPGGEMRRLQRHSRKPTYRIYGDDADNEEIPKRERTWLPSAYTEDGGGGFGYATRHSLTGAFPSVFLSP